MFKNTKSPGTDQIMAQFMQDGWEMFCQSSERNIQIYTYLKILDTTDCSNVNGILFLTSHENFVHRSSGRVKPGDSISSSHLTLYSYEVEEALYEIWGFTVVKMSLLALAQMEIVCFSKM
jgi:hypothetical protein